MNDRVCYACGEKGHIATDPRCPSYGKKGGKVGDGDPGAPDSHYKSLKIIELSQQRTLTT